MSEKREVNIAELLKWSTPKTVKNNTLILRKATPTPEFWSLWKSNRQALKNVGISCKPEGSGWTVLWFQPVDSAKRQADKSQREENVVASRAQDSEIEIPCPAGLAYLGYQKAGIAYALDCFSRGRGCLLGDEMGLGKTPQTIGVINSRPDIQRVIICCPSTLRLNWTRELSRWLTRPANIGVVFQQGGTQLRHSLESLGFFDNEKGQDTFQKIQDAPTLSQNPSSHNVVGLYTSGISGGNSLHVDTSPEGGNPLEQPDINSLENMDLPSGGITALHPSKAPFSIKNPGQIGPSNRPARGIENRNLLVTSAGDKPTFSPSVNEISGSKGNGKFGEGFSITVTRLEKGKALSEKVFREGNGVFSELVHILVVNFDYISICQEILRNVNWDLRVTDEFQYLKNRQAKRTKSTYGIPARMKIALSGTPIENRPIELWTTLCDLDPTEWDPKRGFMNYARNYCGARHNGFGWDFNGATNSDALQYRLRSSIMIRRLKADVLTELPAKRRQIIELDATGCAELLRKEAAEAAEVEANLELLRARVELARCSESREDYQEAVKALRAGQGVAFEKMAERRHQVAIAKLPQVISFVHDSLENGKVLVFGHHLDVIAALKNEFPQAAVITGETPAMQRQGEVDRFQNDPACNVFLGNLAAAEGITLTAGKQVVFAELNWVPGKHAQMEDRAHRIGQKDSVLCTYLVLEGSLDARMAQVIVEKLDVIDKCLDKQTGYAEADIEDVEIHNSVRLSFEEVEKRSKTIPAGIAELAHRGLKLLAGVCDGAVTLDDVGFNGCDTYIGKTLARQESLSPKQVILALRILKKYHRQIGPVVDELIALGVYKSMENPL